MSTPTPDTAEPGTDAGGSAPRPLRADAARNRERVIEAARQELAEGGLDAQMEDVARRAGVGVGTVYRHFETKEALIDAALVARFEEALANMREAEQFADAWQGVLRGFRDAAELNARDRGFCGTIGTQLVLSGAVRPVLDELLAVWARLIARAQRQGAMRRDVGAADIPSLMCALANVVAMSPDRGTWERYVGVVIDGLRAPGAPAERDTGARPPAAAKVRRAGAKVVRNSA